MISNYSELSMMKLQTSSISQIYDQDRLLDGNWISKELVASLTDIQYMSTRALLKCA